MLFNYNNYLEAVGINSILGILVLLCFQYQFYCFFVVQVYGTALLGIMGIIVFLGVKFVNKFASVALVCVLGSIVAIFVGVFVNFNGNESAP